MKWIKDYEGDYVNLYRASHAYIADNGVDGLGRWHVKIFIEGEPHILLKCQEERTARHYLGRLMKKLGAI